MIDSQSHLPQNLLSRLRTQPVKLLLLFVGILLPFVLFGKLAHEIHEGESFSWDTQVLRFIHEYATPHRDSIIAIATRTGGVLAIPLFIAIIFGFRFLKHADNATFFGVAVGGAYVLDVVAKELFRRTRPALFVGPIQEHSYSFPSGHSMVSMAIAVAFIAIAWPTKWRWAAVVLGLSSTFLVGLSRLYLGVHYPSDVLGGWSAALFWVCGLYLILKRSQSAAQAQIRAVSN